MTNARSLRCVTSGVSMTQRAQLTSVGLHYSSLKTREQAISSLSRLERSGSLEMQAVRGRATKRSFTLTNKKKPLSQSLLCPLRQIRPWIASKTMNGVARIILKNDRMRQSTLVTAHLMPKHTPSKNALCVHTTHRAMLSSTLFLRLIALTRCCSSEYSPRNENRQSIYGHETKKDATTIVTWLSSKALSTPSSLFKGSNGLWMSESWCIHQLIWPTDN